MRLPANAGHPIDATSLPPPATRVVVVAGHEVVVGAVEPVDEVELAEVVRQRHAVAEAEHDGRPRRRMCGCYILAGEKVPAAGPVDVWGKDGPPAVSAMARLAALEEQVRTLTERLEASRVAGA